MITRWMEWSVLSRTILVINSFYLNFKCVLLILIYLSEISFIDPNTLIKLKMSVVIEKNKNLKKYNIVKYYLFFPKMLFVMTSNS